MKCLCGIQKNITAALLLLVLLIVPHPQAFAEELLPEEEPVASDTSETDDTDVSKPFVYVPQGESGLRQTMAGLCLEKTAGGSGGYPTSAAFISGCAAKLGLTASGVFPQTVRPDDLFLFFSKETEPDGEAVEIGDLVFFEEGPDRDYLELIGETENRFGLCGIVTALDADGLHLATTDSEGTAVERILSDDFAESMTLVKVGYPGYEQLVWEAISTSLPYGDAALCAIMANIYCESGFNPSAVGDGGDSLGICQWYRERKDNLLLYSAENGYSPESIHTQTEYLAYELQTEKYADVDLVLQSAEESSFGAGYAAYVFCVSFENPEDTISKARFRGTVAQAMYEYYHRETAEKEDSGTFELPSVPLPQINPMRADLFRTGDGDFPIFLDLAQSDGELSIDGERVPSDLFLHDPYGASVTVLQQYMDTLAPGWHDVALISENAFAGGRFRVEFPDASTLMSRPAFMPETTGIFFTDAPAPRYAVDISAAQDCGVVLWYEGTNCFISTQRPGVPVLAPEDCRYLFTPFGEGSSLPCLFAADVSLLDTSCAVNMSGMFKDAGCEASEFSVAGLGKWDVSKVTDMSSMFERTGLSATDWSLGDLAFWDVSAVTDMTAMFRQSGSSALIWSVGDLCNWNTAQVVSMAQMFEGAGYNSVQFILDLRRWDVSNVCTMQAMFRNTGYFTDLFSVNTGVWNISSVVTTEEMFLNAGYAASDWSIGDISLWDVSKVRTMRNMFCGAGHEAAFFSLDMGAWDTHSCTDMAGMFESAGYNAGVFELRGLEKWDVSAVEDFERMFRYSGYTATNYGFDLRNWNTCSATDMTGMFSNAGFTASSFRLQLDGWDTAHVASMRDMFGNAGCMSVSFTLTGPDMWDVSSLVDANGMFRSAGYAADSFILDLNAWDVSSFADAGDLFRDAGCCAPDFMLGTEQWQLPDSCLRDGMFANTGCISQYRPPLWYRP